MSEADAVGPGASAEQPGAETLSRKEKRRLRLRFDDRIDTQTAISSAETVVLAGRCVKLLAQAKGLFAAKFLLAFGLIWPGLLLPWVAKIVTDNVLLERPIGDTEVRFPPFMNPIVAFIDGMTPMEVMLFFAVMYGFLLLLMGTRAGGTGAELFAGADAATQSENRISAGGSEAGGIWGIAEFMVNVRLTQRLANALRTRLFERLSRLPMTTLDDKRIGDSIYRVLYDTPVVPEICYLLTLNPFFILLGAAINLYLIDYSYSHVAPELIWVAWCAFPLAFITTFPASALVRRTNQAKRAAGAATTNAMEETLDNVHAVQSLGGMKRETERFAQRSRESFLRERFALAVGILLLVLVLITMVAAAIYITIVISDNIIDDVMSPGDFFVLFGMYYGIVETAVGIGSFWIKLQDPVAAVRRVFFFLDHSSDDDYCGGAAVGKIERGFTLDNVAFAYPDGRQALDKVNVDLPMGELVAIVGPTGSGKTTLAYLLPAFLRPTAGSIAVDGRSLADLDVNSLREQIAYVFQEHLLLSESIRDNLRLAKVDATDAEIERALAAAACLDFVRTLPNGLDTVLGQSGDTLSVGQQQRLCIARGLIRNTPVLILDEPTAALDPSTENDLVRALRASAKGRLVVVIAHRLSTIRHADRIVFLDGGRVRDVGDHDTLMANADGPYRRFVELQGSSA